MRRHPSVVPVALAVLVFAGASQAAQPQEAESPPVFTVRTSVKATGLVSRSPAAPDLFPERTTSESMLRLRAEPEIRLNKTAIVNVAYEQRLRYTSGPLLGVAAIGILPSEVATPF